MEFVEGVPIDEFGPEQEWRAKVALIREVCEAVSYAHRNLIVHRDLKPSNILVDAEGRPKLLDFGIAKVLSEAVGAGTTVAALTPQYASPEQYTGQAVTTATDIYSLAVVLYKMVTGRLPHEVAAGASPGVWAKAICEAEPVRPGVDTDLDKVLLMALRKEPERRYLSMEQFSEDLGRVLADEPILARTPSLGYRAKKFVQRNQASVAIAAVAMVGVVVAASLAFGQWRASQRRFEQVRRLARTFVFDLDGQIAGIEGTTQARETIVRTGLEYLNGLSGDARGDRELEEEVALGYAKIGDIQGFPTDPNLGRARDALASYRKADAIFQRLGPPPPEGVMRRAGFYQRFAAVLRFDHQFGEAGKAYQKALASYEGVAARVECGRLTSVWRTPERSAASATWKKTRAISSKRPGNSVNARTWRGQCFRKRGRRTRSPFSAMRRSGWRPRLAILAN